ncbi:MAG: L-histidine N(alpha)-methyltransferase [Candidatus Micrarchaeota archaeon]|nr:L-histidine N(alpha)-methyltransferase [Candidatus Micrarchaeota archaeon]
MHTLVTGRSTKISPVLFDFTTRTVTFREPIFSGVPSDRLATKLSALWKAEPDRASASPETVRRIVNVYAIIYADLYRLNPELADNATKIMEKLPFELCYKYAKLVVGAFLHKEKFGEILGFLLNPKNIELIKRYALSNDNASRPPSNIAGIPLIDSGVLNSVLASEQRTALITELTHEYGYYEMELNLLRKNMPKIAEKIGCNENYGIVALGPDVEKTQEIITAVDAQHGNSGRVLLVDSNLTALDNTCAGLVEKGYEKRIIRTHYTFEQLVELGIPVEMAQSTIVTTNLGTTFCNLPPWINFQVMNAIRTKYALIGLYTLNENHSNITDIMFAYTGNAMREQAKVGAMLLGISAEDVDKCDYNIYMYRIDFSNRYGSELKNVEVLIAAFDVNEKIESGLGKIYQPGQRIGGFYSIKYTPSQFRRIAAIHGYSTEHNVHNDDVGIYLLKKDG